MAIFNPDVRTAPDPDYLRYSRPIETPKADVSLGTALSGFGDVVKSTATGVDTIFKTDIENQVEAKAQTIKDIFQTGLETSLGKKTADNNVVSTESVAVVPEDLQDGLDNVGRLKNARAAKAFPESYYLQRLDTLAKDLRSQYPGYRDFIDKEISSVTGKNMANAYVDNLVAQFKAQGEGKDADQTRAIALAQPHLGEPGVLQILGKVINGEASYFDVARVVAPVAAIKFQREEASAVLKSSKENVEGKALLAEKQIDAIAPKQLSTFYTAAIDVPAGTTSQDASGNPVKTKTPAEIEQIVRDSLEGKKPISDTDAQKLGASYAAQADAFKKRLIAQWTADGQAAALGTKRVNEKADEVIKPLTDFAGLITNNQLGAAYFHKNLAQAATHDMTASLFNDKDLGQVYTMMSSMKDIGGPNAAADMIKTIMSTSLTTGGPTIDTTMQGYVAKRMLPLATQPDIRLGKVNTVNDVVNFANADKVPLPVVLEPALKMIDRITRPDVSDQEKYNLAKSIADPGNLGLMAKFTTDGRDKDNKYVQGRYILFGKLVSEDFAKEVKRLSDKGDPSLWEDYSNNVKHWFGTEMFAPDIRALQNVRTDLVRLGWNSETKQFVPEAAEPSTLLGRYGQSNLQDIRLETAKTEGIVNRVNMGLRSLEGYAKASGVNVESFLLQSLDLNGFDIAGNVQGIPGRMIRAIKGSVLKTQGKKLQD